MRRLLVGGAYVINSGRRPRNVDSGLQPLAHRIFKGLSPSYDRVLMLATLMQDRYWKKWLLEVAPVAVDMTILDIGCGTGVLEEYLPRAGGERDGGGGGCSVIGLDLTEEMIRVAQRKRIPSIRLLSVGDGEHLPFRDASFDMVASCYVVKYCNPKALASEMIRVLRPGGTVILYDFSSPRGLLAPFHAFYVYGAMRILAALLKPIDPGQALTYSELPSVIQSRIWDESFAKVLSAVGFSKVGERRLTGGVVTGFWATKQEEETGGPRHVGP
jgi:demethylmenaquinone methyltransferase / 2-methoxy-6-polyprenyl-1,4-benzoquinol methylase